MSTTPNVPTSFAGFSPRTLAFFAQLKRHNNRAWFLRHKEAYLTDVLHPARAFVHDMAPLLAKIFPGIVGDPLASIFRIQRDTRFSSDKAPYKTHLGIFFWQAPGKKLDRPGFYLELDDAGLRLYYGWYLFPPDILKTYRQSVVDEDLGQQLLRAVAKVKKSGVTVGGQAYKRIPRGFSVDPARADLIRHNTLYTQLDCGQPSALFSAKLIPFCLKQWQKSAPLYKWTLNLLK